MKYSVGAGRRASPPWRARCRPRRPAKSFQATGPEQAGRCWNGEANWLSSAAAREIPARRCRAAASSWPSKPVRRSMHVHGVVGAALLAVVDDVDAGGDLLLHHVGDGGAHRGIERGAVAVPGLSFRRAAAPPPWPAAAGCRCGWSESASCCAAWSSLPDWPGHLTLCAHGPLDRHPMRGSKLAGSCNRHGHKARQDAGPLGRRS